MLKKDDKKNEKKGEKEIDKLVKKLTLDEKIAMIHGASLFRSGAVERLGIPAIETSDGPMGVRAEFMDDRWIPAGNQDDMVSYLQATVRLHLPGIRNWHTGQGIYWVLRREDAAKM